MSIHPDIKLGNPFILQYCFSPLGKVYHYDQGLRKVTVETVTSMGCR